MENLENMETVVCENTDIVDEVLGEEAETTAATEESEGKHVDIAGLAELGLMIVGGVVVAKKIWKTGSKAVHGFMDKRKAKKEAKAAEKAKTEKPAATEPAKQPEPESETTEENKD